MKGKELPSPPEQTAFALQLDYLKSQWVYIHCHGLQVLSQAYIDSCLHCLSCMLSLWADAAGARLLCSPGGDVTVQVQHQPTLVRQQRARDASITTCNGKGQA